MRDAAQPAQHRLSATALTTLESTVYAVIPRIQTMRRYAYCMILLLASSAAWASTGLADADREACVSSGSATHGTPSDGAVTIPATSLPKQVTPATTHGGGSDGDLLPTRMRTPKWHSFLPGMFR